MIRFWIILEQLDEDTEDWMRLGALFAITIDHQTLQDDTVTLGIVIPWNKIE